MFEFLKCTRENLRHLDRRLTESGLLEPNSWTSGNHKLLESSKAGKKYWEPPTIRAEGNGLQYGEPPRKSHIVAYAKAIWAILFYINDKLYKQNLLWI